MFATAAARPHPEIAVPSDGSITTRRSFIFAAGFGGISLYGVWTAYDAAPSPFDLLRSGHGHGTEAAAAGHGAVAGGPTLEEFRTMTAAFVDRYRIPDGSVRPRASATFESQRHPPPAPQVQVPSHAHAGHAASPRPVDAHGAMRHGRASIDDVAAVDVFMLAEKWFYEPSHLRLDAGIRYRFRMMASDVAHGASIQLGTGGRMLRLRPGRESMLDAIFTRPGRYLVYCTVYCGVAHDRMQGRIDVA
jgi:cytochrome c oxidase subunit II